MDDAELTASADRQACPLGAQDAEETAAKQRTLVVATPFQDNALPGELGHEAYSYRFVYQALAPLLQRWARIQEIDRPESRLDFALWKARQQNQRAFHFSFLPLQSTYLSPHAPAIAFPFWEFPDLPNINVDDNPRNNWAHIAARLQLIFTACRFTRDTFVNAGVATPIEVVPVPIRAAYFDTPQWRPGQRVVLETPAYVFPQESPTREQPSPWRPPSRSRFGLVDGIRHGYRTAIRPRLPGFIDRGMSLAFRVANTYRKLHAEDTQVAAQITSSLALEGAVYTTILNPFDERKNWTDLLSGFLHALGQRPDVLLVVKLVLPARLVVPGLNMVLKYYRRLNQSHRCRVAFVPGFLSQEQMFELTRGTTYYVNTTRAEGSCLPLQDYLAAGRPGIAPTHTAMADYFDGGVGFPLASSPEPAVWPHDPLQRFATSWHRLDWQTWVEQLRTSFELAQASPRKYGALGDQARQRMDNYASTAKVWPILKRALDGVDSAAAANAPVQIAPRRRAS